MKNIKYILFLCLLFLPLSISAMEYNITNYYIHANVNKNNVYDITEYYNVFFLEKTNFKREIVLRPKVYLSDGKFISYITEVNDIDSDDLVSTSSNSKKYLIKFNDAQPNTSSQYILSYKYNMGSDLDSDKDIVFLNIVDGTLDIIADATSFTLMLPDEINKDQKVMFFKNGKEINDLVEYKINDNKIEGSIHSKINLKDVISVQIRLQDGYFVGVKKTDSNTSYLLLLLPIISLIGGIVALRKYKKSIKDNDDIVDVSSLFDSVEVAYLYKGKLTVPDFASLIFHLANDGYISLKNYGSKENVYFKIKKVKEYDKDNAAEKIMFDGLFQNSDEIEAHDINGIFRPYYIDAKKTLQNKKNKKRLFYTLAKKWKVLLLMGSYIGVFLLQIKPLYNIIGSYVYATIISIGLSIIIINLYKPKNKLIKYVMILISIIIIILETYSLIDFKLNLWIYCIGVILVLLSLFIENKIPIRTVYGDKIFNSIELFRLDILSMQDETFDMKIKANSNYFFDMIPYMLVFDLHSWWFNKFGKRVSDQPAWYESSELYTIEKLDEFIQEVVMQLIVPMQSMNAYEDELLHQAPNKLL